MTNRDRILKSRDITLPTKVRLVKAMVFPVVMYGCESWTVKKAECQRIDAFELWCWRRLFRVPWTARRFNHSILKEISPGCSLESESESEVAQSCLTLCDPMDCRPPGSSVHGILQARILEWVARPSSRGSFPPRNQTHIAYVSFIGRWVFTTSSTWESPCYLRTYVKWAKNTVNHQKLPLTEHLFCAEHVLNVLHIFSHPSLAKIS